MGHGGRLAHALSPGFHKLSGCLMSEIDDLETMFASKRSGLRFRQRPDPLPGDLRLPWRLSTLAMVLARCRGRTAAPQQLHLIVTALRSPLLQQAILRGLAGGALPGDELVRDDPALTRTIRIAHAAGLVEAHPTRIRLTEDGLALARRIATAPNVLQKEKEFLSRLPASITQKSFAALLEAK
jgi:hypothetical protein